MANIDRVEAGSWDKLLEYWWQWVLVALSLTCVLIGSCYIAFSTFRRLSKYFKKKGGPSAEVTARITQHLQKYSGSGSRWTLGKNDKRKAASLSIYLGGFDKPVTEAQARILRDRDLVILDPLQPNVVDAVSQCSLNSLESSRKIGRLNLDEVLNSNSRPHNLEPFLIGALDQIMTIILTRYQDLEGRNNGFTGVLLASWQSFPTPILHELCEVLFTLGLEVYLETAAPEFLKDPTAIAPQSVTGLVIRNGLMSENAKRRDCFDLEALRVTIKGFVSQSCVRDFTVLAWETYDDDVMPSNAVSRRTFTWCSFYNVIPWIGPKSALSDPSVEVVRCEPLGAFDWLKDSRVMELHELWKTKRDAQDCDDNTASPWQLYATLSGLETSAINDSCAHDASTKISIATSTFSEDLDWYLLKEEAVEDPLSTSGLGSNCNGFGCFPLGVDVSLGDFQEVVFSQRNLKKLELLDIVSPENLQQYGATFTNFITDVDVLRESTALGSPCSPEAVEDLAATFYQSLDYGINGVRLYLGLHSGFQVSTRKQFWGVYQIHPSGNTDLYVSKNVQDLAGSILHTFLSSRGFTRRQCFAVETIFARWQRTVLLPHDVPTRVGQDIELLTPEECIRLLQRVSLVSGAEKDSILCGIKSVLIERLVDVPTLSQLKTINTVGYLNGTILVDELVRSRVEWHCQCKRSHPNLATAISLFQEIQARISKALMNRNRQALDGLIDALGKSLRNSTVDAIGDIFALAVFCTMRKMAFEEVYIEVTDRNPLFNDQPDQAAAFAELFALGSRCEAYFDVSPSQFGQLLSAKFRDYYGTVLNQPPDYEETQQALSSAYAEAQIDVDPHYKSHEMPQYQHFTFLSVFAIPALIDILLLTTTGHGLYLSGDPYMSLEEQHGATVALMVSLILSGAIGTWITCGGTYYLASMAFSAMNYFVVTRLLGGFAFTIIAALIGFIAFACTTTTHQAAVFFLYFVALTSYLCLLAALANYQFIGSAFQSGRLVIILCIPVLFISPITTIFIAGYDLEIYLTVLYVFVTLLLLGVRRTGALWTTWYQTIELIDDTKLRNWYTEKMDESSRESLERMSDPALLRVAREALLHDIVAEQNKFFFSTNTRDELVVKLVKSYPATVFLMDWYCRFSGVTKPILYSSSWNVQTKVALNTLQKYQLGIRFHNGFIHWRQAGDEIGCTMLYFVIALLDRWIMLINGDPMIGLAPQTKSLRMPVGFGLAYYLIGAVLLDTNAQKLHQLAGKTEEILIPSHGDIANAVEAKAAKRKKLYWKTLSRYLFWHVWGAAVMSAIVWVFSPTSRGQGTIIFLSYVLAYTGLLWYQYTKIFAGPHALKPLLIGTAIGLPLGFILVHFFPDFGYCGIIALGVATWSVAVMSLWAAKILGPPEDQPRPRSQNKNTYHSYSSPGPDQGWSQKELQGLFEQVSELPESERLLVDPESALGKEVKDILTQYSHIEPSDLEKKAFPESENLLALSRKLFNDHLIMVHLVSLDHFERFGPAMRAVSAFRDSAVNFMVGCNTNIIVEGYDTPPGYQLDVAELLLQAVAERYLNYTPHDASLICSVWANNRPWNNVASYPSTLERQFQILSEEGNGLELVDFLQKQLIQDLCLGFDCDMDWESLPIDLRQYLINRSLGVIPDFSDSQITLINEKLKLIPGQPFDNYVARRNYAAYSGAISLSRARHWLIGARSRLSHQTSESSGSHQKETKALVDLLGHASAPPKFTLYDKILKYSGIVYHNIGILCKFFSIAFVADPEYQREVKYAFPEHMGLGNSVARWILISIWIYSKFIQKIFLPTFLFHHRRNLATVWENIQGMEISFKRHRVLIRGLDGVMTGFVHPVDSSSFKLLQYRGDFKVEPADSKNLCAVNLYSTNMALLRRIELNEGNTINDYEYEYYQVDPAAPRRISKSDILTSPITRKGIAGNNAMQNVNYNQKGQIDSGSYVKDGNLVRFQYHYQKASGHVGSLLRAEFVLPHMSCTVSWCAAPRRRPERLETWIPHSQVTEATFVVGADVWESKYFYDHKFHPTIVTTLNGQRVDTPSLILYDHLDVLKKPKNVSFLDDNPLFSFTSTRSNPFTRWLGVDTRRYPISTSQARSWLWKAWRDDPSFDGVVVRWLDERLLRRDPVLQPYWRKRDFGNLDLAEKFLDDNRDAVMASVDLDSTISNWTPLAMKINDLHSFGQGGDACGRTRSNVTAQEDDEMALHVIAVDTGTWPNEGGGVSACRSDVINNLRTIKWHMVAEAANDFGIPKRQIERNIQSLKIIPLWGLDLLTPIHGLFANRLDSEVEHIATHTTLLDIERTFIPIMEALISGARAVDFSMDDVKQVTRALVNLNTYFKDSRHWSVVWRSDFVKAAWRKAWLSQTASNSRPPSEWLRAETPTLGQFDQSLELWSRYLFIFSIPIPEKMPAVFQASHHSVSASYGIVCKIKRGCTLQIWDHAISWRETNLYLSSALCALSPFVRNSLLGLMRVTSMLTLHHADTILPCADFFNPNWEAEIGTCQGRIEHRAKFRRKIDPVVNGITDMDRFAPVKEITTAIPTVTMLSHLWYAKDIKTALLAADIIINTWGFKDYRLEVYGAMDKVPSYTTNCQEIIATKSLRHQVSLMGEGNPIDVLKRTWVFMNSSISEGLPLALGEAALTGAPVVCTDVGASLRVLTNPEDKACYSAVVAPNDALALARAQIKILALLEEWSKYADTSASISDSSFPEKPTPADVDRITKRMYEQADARRRLGAMSRKIVQKSFSGDRYLREHEQMLWIGKARNDMAHPLSPRTSLAPPRPVLLSERTSAPVGVATRGSGLQRASMRMGRDSVQDDSTGLPSLSWGTGNESSRQRTSISTGMVPSVLGHVTIAEQKWVKGPAEGQVKVVDMGMGLRRERRRIGAASGLSATEIMI